MISEVWNFFKHPEKGGQMGQKQSASPHTCILVVFILKWEKKPSSHIEIVSFIYPKKKWNKMKMKPCIE